MYASCDDNLIESYVRILMFHTHMNKILQWLLQMKKEHVSYSSFTHFDIDKLDLKIIVYFKL